MTQKRALVIDDDPDITTYHSTLLSDNGWEVVTAHSGDEGIQLARENPPDLILLDVMMPERGGLSTLAAIRKEPSLGSVKVILITGVQETLSQDYKAFLDRFKRHSPDAYIEKPVNPEMLLEVIDSLIGS